MWWLSNRLSKEESETSKASSTESNLSGGKDLSEIMWDENRKKQINIVKLNVFRLFMITIFSKNLYIREYSGDKVSK